MILFNLEFALTIIISQILSTIIYKTDFLNPDIFFLYIYQTEQYSSLALILIFFIYIQKNLFNKTNNSNYYKSFLVSLILLVYVYLSHNLLLYLYLLLYIIFLIAFTKKYILNYCIFLFFLILTINVTEIHLTFNLNEFLINRSYWYNIYFTEIISSPYNLLFGSNINNELYKNTSGIYNYYLDFIYNFGLVSLIPLIILMFLTIRKTLVLKNTFILDPQNASKFFILILILFLDSFLKVSLKQPYIGIIIFFIWGIYYSNLNLKIKELNQ